MRLKTKSDNAPASGKRVSTTAGAGSSLLSIPRFSLCFSTCLSLSLPICFRNWFWVKALLERGSIWLRLRFIWSLGESAVSSELRRILLPRSSVLNLGYAGGDGGSTLFRHVGSSMAPRWLFVDPLRYGPPLLCLSMVLRVGDGGLPLEVCLSVHIASSSLLAPGRGLTSTVFCFSVLDKRRMSIVKGGHLNSFGSVWRLSIWILVVSTSPILASSDVGGNFPLYVLRFIDKEECKSGKITDYQLLQATSRGLWHPRGKTHFPGINVNRRERSPEV
ncbi:hypothetical protein HID58_083012 [Brassica napus]|uniref:Uncharacterized protein n=1 Tax=Brassica napus TaxID=3708 RepID=A0ABQ7YCD1_BRANA|nr:hypothetical protein HID58_083012 [Brassica napus]